MIWDWEQRTAENAFPLVISVVAYSLGVFRSRSEGQEKERTMLSDVFSNSNLSCLIWGLQLCGMVIDGICHSRVKSEKISCL